MKIKFLPVIWGWGWYFGGIRLLSCHPASPLLGGTLARRACAGRGWHSAGEVSPNPPPPIVLQPQSRDDGDTCVGGSLWGFYLFVPIVDTKMCLQRTVSCIIRGLWATLCHLCPAFLGSRREECLGVKHRDRRHIDLDAGRPGHAPGKCTLLVLWRRRLEHPLTTSAFAMRWSLLLCLPAARATNALVRPTAGVVSVKFSAFAVVLAGGGGGAQPRWAVCTTGAGAHQGAGQP